MIEVLFFLRQLRLRMVWLHQKSYCVEGNRYCSLAHFLPRRNFVAFVDDLNMVH